MRSASIPPNRKFKNKACHIQKCDNFVRIKGVAEVLAKMPRHGEQNQGKKGPLLDVRVPKETEAP